MILRLEYVSFWSDITGASHLVLGVGGAGGPRAGSKDPVQSEWPAPAQPWEHTQRRSPLPGGSTLSKGPLSGGSMLSIGAPSLVGARSPKAPLSLVAQVHLRQAERQAASLLRLAHVPEATYTWFTRGATLAGVQLWEEPGRLQSMGSLRVGHD